MICELEHAFQTVDGQSVTLTLRDTLLQAIRLRELKAIGYWDSAPDLDTRWRFLSIAAYVVNVAGEGLNGFAPDDITDLQTFNAQYRDFASVVNERILEGIEQAVTALRSPNVDPVTKHDDVLTDEERADPN